MTHQEKLDHIRQRCIAANPGIKRIVQRDTTGTFRDDVLLEEEERPIRLADVLLAAQERFSVAYTADAELANQQRMEEFTLKLLELWNLRDDNLKSQSEVLVAFLYALKK